MRRNSENVIFERLIAAGSYLTLGLVGMVWFLLSFILLKKPMSRFLTCNIVQSFVISILYAIISLCYTIFIGILVNLPWVGRLLYRMHVFLFETPIYNTLSFINFFILIFLCYLSVFALLGKLAYVPFVTDITKNLNV